MAPRSALGHRRSLVAVDQVAVQVVGRRRQLCGPIPAEWYCDWAGRPARCPAPRPTRQSWLVIADSGLGAEIGHVLGDDSPRR